MKNIYKIVGVSAFTLLVLTACNNVPVSNTDVVKSDNINVATPDLLANGQFGSRYGKDLKCDMLKSSTQRESCEIQINEMIGSLLESEILSSFDLNRCDEFSGDAAAQCKSQLSEAGVQGPVSIEEVALYNEAINGVMPDPTDVGQIDPFSVVFDIKKCSELKTKGYKEYCEKQINQRMEQAKFEQIIQSGDETKCDTLKGNFVNDCKMFFGQDPNREVVTPEERLEAPVLEVPATPLTEPVVLEETIEAPVLDVSTIPLTEVVEAQ